MDRGGGNTIGQGGGVILLGRAGRRGDAFLQVPALPRAHQQYGQQDGCSKGRSRNNVGVDAQAVATRVFPQPACVSGGGSGGPGWARGT